MNDFNETPRKVINTREGGLTKFFAKVYGILALGIGISAAAAFVTLNSTFGYVVASSPMLFFGLIIAEFALVIYLSRSAIKSAGKSLVGFIAYSVINGITISFSLALAGVETAATAFVAAASTFLVTAVIGMFIKKDLSGLGQAAIVLLVGAIIATVINIFTQSQGLDLFLNYLIVVIFAGLTAYDNQRIRGLYMQYGEEMSGTGIATNCALSLYLDFINLLLAFIRIFGNRD